MTKRRESPRFKQNEICSKRVVIGILDPDERGQGLRKLEAAGIIVAICDEEDLKNEIKELNREFIHSRTKPSNEEKTKTQLPREVSTVEPPSKPRLLRDQKQAGASSLEHQISGSANPKPIRIGDLILDDVFLMVGNNMEPIEIDVRYTHEQLKTPKDLMQTYSNLAKMKAEDAKIHGYPYFNGPNTRLTRITQANSRQAPTGEETKGFVLELGPVSWEEYSVLNSFLDESVFPGEEQDTIRKRFADSRRLYQYNPDLRWCQLSNILVVDMIPITRDGFGLIQRRSLHGVSNERGLMIGGVSENIHRFKDEAHRDNLRHRINALGQAAGQNIDHTYRPMGVPSPFLTAQRGIYEEVSTELYKLLPTNHDKCKFLNAVFGLANFHPRLAGVFELDLDRDEVERLVQEFPGSDHSEFTSIEYIEMNEKNNDTLKVLSQRENWSPGGLSALISAIRYWSQDPARSGQIS